MKTKQETIDWLKTFDQLLGSGEHNNHDGIRSAIYHLENCNQVEAQVGKNLAEENKEGLTEWRTVLLNEKHHTLLKHILEMGIKDGWLGNEETKKLLRIITTAEKMDYYVGRKLTKAKLDKLTKFLQEQY